MLTWGQVLSHPISCFIMFDHQAPFWDGRIFCSDKTGFVRHDHMCMYTLFSVVLISCDWILENRPSTYAHKLKFTLLHQWITTFKDYSRTASPLAIVNWSALLNGILLTLWCHGCGNGTMGRHLLGGQYPKLLVLLARCLLGLVVWQRHLLVACTGSSNY